MEAVTIFGPISVGWATDEDADGNITEVGMGLKSPFFEVDKVLTGGDSFKINIKKEDGIPTEAEAKLFAVVDGCGIVDIEMSWSGGEHELSKAILFNGDGTAFELEKKILIEEEVVFESASVCGLDLLSGVTLEDSLEGKIDRERFFEPAP